MATKLKNLTLGTQLVTPGDVASPTSLGLVKVGSGLVVDAQGNLYLKIIQDGKLFLPTGETTQDGKTVYRALSLCYSAEQEAAVADISSQAYYWNGSSYVAVE